MKRQQSVEQQIYLMLNFNNHFQYLFRILSCCFFQQRAPLPQHIVVNLSDIIILTPLAANLHP